MKSARKEVERRLLRAVVELNEGSWAALVSIANECADVAAVPLFLY
jgi:hypothetical protein